VSDDFHNVAVGPDYFFRPIIGPPRILLDRHTWDRLLAGPSEIWPLGVITLGSRKLNLAKAAAEAQVWLSDEDDLKKMLLDVWRYPRSKNILLAEAIRKMVNIYLTGVHEARAGGALTEQQKAPAYDLEYLASQLSGYLELPAAPDPRDSFDAESTDSTGLPALPSSSDLSDGSDIERS
jgi:hypothetical protein